MNTINNTEFDVWCDLFYATCKRLGYTGRIDPDSMTNDYNDEMDAEEAATEFVDEMNS